MPQLFADPRHKGVLCLSFQLNRGKNFILGLKIGIDLLLCVSSSFLSSQPPYPLCVPLLPLSTPVVVPIAVSRIRCCYRRCYYWRTREVVDYTSKPPLVGGFLFFAYFDIGWVAYVPLLLGFQSMWELIYFCDWFGSFCCHWYRCCCIDIQVLLHWLRLHWLRLHWLRLCNFSKSSQVLIFIFKIYLEWFYNYFLYVW